MGYRLDSSCDLVLKIHKSWASLTPHSHKLYMTEFSEEYLAAVPRSARPAVDWLGPCSRPPGVVKRPQRSLAFSIANRFCMALLYGRAGRLTALFGVFRPGQAGAAHESGRTSC